MNPSLPRAGRSVAGASALFGAGLLLVSLGVGGVRRPAQAAMPRPRLHFEPNVGQFGSGTRFVSRGPGYTLAVTPTEATLALRDPDGKRARGNGARGCRIGMRLLGADPQAKVTGNDRLPGIVNYFLGNDPEKWRTGVSTYDRVRCAGVYPGIDAVYYGTGERELEYDLVVSPGADPGRIRLAFSGAGSVRLDGNGDLLLATGAGAIRQRKPIAYQEIDGARRGVEAAYRLAGAEAGFRLGQYDRSRPLVIDPVLSYSTYLGGTGEDAAFGVAVGSDGTMYVSGVTDSSNFPISNALQPTRTARDAFITRFSSDGSTLIFSTYLGGSGDDCGHDVAVGSDGSAYLTGTTQSSNFPTTALGLQLSLRGTRDAFACKLNATGSSLVYSTYLGGSDLENHRDSATAPGLSGTLRGGWIAVDAAGSAYVTGSTDSLDFPLEQPQQAGFGGVRDAFLSKLTPDGANLVYSTFFGGNGLDAATGIALDASVKAYITGATFSTNLPVTANAFQPARAGSSDAFAARLSEPCRSAPTWAAPPRRTTSIQPAATSSPPPSRRPRSTWRGRTPAPTRPPSGSSGRRGAPGATPRSPCAGRTPPATRTRG